MGSILVVFGFPPLQLSSQIFLMPKVLSSIELLRVCLVAPLHFAVQPQDIREGCSGGKC